MSRAFVSESDGDDEPDLPPLKSPLPPGARNYMTPDGAARLRAEIDQLNLAERPNLATAVAAARDSGNEADRGELRAARHDLATLDRRLDYLGELLRTAEVVHPPAGKPERVSFGLTVVVHDKMLGKDESYRIVGIYESNPENGMISWISPIAVSLRGREVGDTVSVPLPGGERVFKIVSITVG